jgi:outer membrane protein
MRKGANNRANLVKRPRGQLRCAKFLLSVGWLACAIFVSPAYAGSPSLSPGPTVIDLPKALELALQNNPELKAAQSDIGVASAQRDRAESGHWPTVRLQAGWTEYRRNQRLYPAASPGDPAVISNHLLGGDLVLSFPLYSGGRVSRNVDAAEFEEQSARDTSRWTKVDLVFQVTATYYSILAQRRLIAALASAEEAMAKNIERLDALVAERKAAPLDRQRMEVRLAALEQRRVQEGAALEVQTLSLLSLIGLSGDRASFEIVGELDKPSLESAPSSESLVQDAIARRPDCRALRSAVRAQERRIDVAQAGHYPQLSVQGSYGLRWGLWPSEQPDGESALADVGQVGLYLDVPLFEGGRVTADVREEQARLTSVRERLRQAELRVRLEVEAALLDFKSALERVELSEATIGQATEAFRVETEKHTEGKSTISDVLSAQSDLLDAEASRARALADANIAAAAITRALGDEI